MSLSNHYLLIKDVHITGRTRGTKSVALVAAVAMYLFIVSVALSRDPRGVLLMLAR